MYYRSDAARRKTQQVCKIDYSKEHLSRLLCLDDELSRITSDDSWMDYCVHMDWRVSLTLSLNDLDACFSSFSRWCEDGKVHRDWLEMPVPYHSLYYELLENSD